MAQISQLRKGEILIENVAKNNFNSSENIRNEFWNLVSSWRPFKKYILYFMKKKYSKFE